MSREAFVLLRCGIAEFVNAAKQIPETDEIYRIYGDVDWLIHTYDLEAVLELFRWRDLHHFQVLECMHGNSFLPKFVRPEGNVSAAKEAASS